jgi:type II secretory pathway pseudopilin PulG
MKDKLKQMKGITLIALVITIIVLLILASVSIATLTGENGILTKATTAKEESRRASIQEAIDLYNINKEAGMYLGKEAESLDKVLTDLQNQGLLTADEVAQIKETGEITIGDKTIVVDDVILDETTGLASEILTVNLSAETSEEKSPYVKYNGMICRVLYNDSTHGLQIITDEDVEEVTLGSGDENVTASDFTYSGDVEIDDNFRKAALSYNKVVDTLNNIAKTYKDTKGIATDARSAGSNSILTSDSVFEGDTAGYFSGDDITYIYEYGWNYKFKEGDDNKEEDVTRINKLGLKDTSKTWLASRRVVSSNSNASGLSATSFQVDGTNFIHVNDKGSATSSSVGPYGVRPVFLLSANATISGGNGSSKHPYIIE